MEVHGTYAPSVTQGLQNIVVTLHQARHALILQTDRPLNAAVGQGKVFDYFDELRQVVDLFFVDPYLSPVFVSRYLTLARDSVGIRLLNHKELAATLPAVDLFVSQLGSSVALRLTPNIHDRYLFVDSSVCDQSGASFKDGGKLAPTTIA